MHSGQLRFFEIRRHPDLVGFGYEHQGLSRLDARAELDGTLADDAIGRRIDFRIAQVEQRLIEDSFGCIGVSLVRGDRLQVRRCGFAC